MASPWPRPIAVVARIRAARRAEGDQERDTARILVSAAAALTGERNSSNGAQVDWGAALHAELASITVPRERLRAALAMLGTLIGSDRACSASHADA